MTRAQANALSQALAGQTIAHVVSFAYDAGGVESASVALDPALIYTGAQLAQLTTYCANHALALTIKAQQMGVT